MVHTAIETAPLADEARRIRLAFSLMVAAIMAATLSAFTASILQDPDSWWHVKVGLDILESRAFPVVDTYSFTFEGHPWIAKEWLSQVLFALAYQAADWRGVALLTIATIALTVFLLSWHLSAALKPTLAAGLAVVLACLVGSIFNARPHIFTLPIAVVWTACLFRAAHDKREPPLWLLPLLCLWANLHATFTFGFVIAAFAGLDFLARSRLSDLRLLAKWCVFGLLCPLVSLLNPYGVKAILATLTVAHGNEAVPYLIEWRPFSASTDYLQEAALLLAFFGVLISGTRISWPKALFFIFTLHVYLLHTRFVYLVFLLVPIALAAEIARQHPSLSAEKWAAGQRDGVEEFFSSQFHRICGGVAILLVGAVAFFVSASPIEPSQKTSAKAALAFAERHGLSGNVLNSYNFGGTLIFHGIKTFIDGRTDQLFLGGFTKTDEDMGSSAGKALLEEQLGKYAIEWALLSAGDGRIPFFDEVPGWKRAYADEYAVIYARRD